MRIYIGADHRGFELKEELKKWLIENEYEVEDVGNHIFDPEDDFVDPAVKVAEMIDGGAKEERGILICGSGHGVEIVANRFRGVRAVVGFNADVSKQGREHEDVNVLVLPANWVTPEEAVERVQLFLQTEASSTEKYQRRRQRIENLRIS
ncbi:ribose-5-phosphate isomerase [Candidatus Collierbacteria bacterium CG09_land_8_20_14_0_10_46_12]|uniref:Ribose-5-phosphate isomerase n=1 Tax=Candidatus Collierbacteria bacterium CG09_land_8_20_14_0_10_46_12 TaxID=1974533 RepID=A0A2H0X1R6_9BACT|nr:MAG: ribose-5-phosphate isomerase [Candidatus Collierbacteria bacterium CG09_land_8_20_14_0_10_46_12]